MQRGNPASRLRLICFMLWCLGWVAVAALSLMPPAMIPDVGGDKLAHMLAYAWMAAATVTFCRCPDRLALMPLTTVCARQAPWLTRVDARTHGALP